MKSACFLLFVFFFGLVVCQNSCDLQGPYACSGGDILGMDFGDDEDDDFFEYFTSSGDTTTTDSCTVQQQGVYSISGSTIEVEFEIDDDECIISGDSNDCECIDNLTLTVSNNCGTIEGPNGETCTPADTCSDSFTCPGGATPIDNPDNEPDANGCGPSAFPFAGPSFSFLECCEQHDFCYGTCGTSKVQCDNDFYSCMACSCEEEYDDPFSRFGCEQLACSYFQLVDEFGCFAFNGGQEDSCICPGKGAVKATSGMTPISKFGPIHPSLKQTEFFCDAPFEAECTPKPDDPDDNDDGNNDDGNNDDENNDDGNNDDGNIDDDNNDDDDIINVDDDNNDDNNDDDDDIVNVVDDDDNNDDNNDDDDDIVNANDDDDDNDDDSNDDDDLVNINDDDDDSSDAPLVAASIVVFAVVALIL